MRRSALLLCLLLPALTACGTIQFPYRMDVRQGNYVTQDMVSRLRPGMTEREVRAIMGSPLLIDPFRNNRWDYVYRFEPGKGAVEQRRITLLFADGKLSRVDGDVVGASADKPATK